ncbi:MAG: hypothetical protein J7M29_12575, partial [Verrucomicrobia bacterium]|nr:hypothetical protein [Verrucomicrobiota bacterium]
VELHGDLALCGVLEPDPEQRVRLKAFCEPGGALRLRIEGPAQARGVIEQSADLQTWRDWKVVELDAGGGAVTPILPASPSAASFYRWRLSPEPAR